MIVCFACDGLAGRRKSYFSQTKIQNQKRDSFILFLARQMRFLNEPILPEIQAAERRQTK
jgi:hypothetical protein